MTYKVKFNNREYDCVIDLTIKVCGGKWKPLILWHINKNITLRFNEINKNITKISHKVLSQQLKELEVDGIIHREVYPEVPPKVEYSLTDIGKSIIPILESMGEWGYRYIKTSSK